jgi:DNA-binding NarL/FixJ family response regulator
VGRHEDDEAFDALIDRSSLGTPGARRLRSRASATDMERVQEVRDQTAKEMRLESERRTRGALETLAQRADAGDKASSRRLTDLLAEHGDITALARQADKGDSHAAHRLIALLQKRIDLNQLERQAGDDNKRAASLAVDLLLHQHNLEARVRVLGAEHLDTLASRHNLANALAELGEYQRAAELHQHNLEARVRVLGAEHLDTLASRHNLANAVQSALSDNGAELATTRASAQTAEETESRQARDAFRALKPREGHSDSDRLPGGGALETMRQQRPAPGLSVLPRAVNPIPDAAMFSALVVDDHPLLREAISARLRTMGAGTVYEAASVAEARARAQTSGPCDLAVLDLDLPDGSGLDLVTELRSQGWNRLMVLASSDDPYTVRSAFQAGAQAYLLKSASAAIVTDGVRRVLHGGVYADPTLAPLLATGTQVPGTDNTPKELSAREVEVLQLVADGQSNKEIGEALGLSALTVKSHLTRIGRKLGTSDRAQMVALAMRAGTIR